MTRARALPEREALAYAIARAYDVPAEVLGLPAVVDAEPVGRVRHRRPLLQRLRRSPFARDARRYAPVAALAVLLGFATYHLSIALGGLLLMAAYGVTP